MAHRYHPNPEMDDDDRAILFDHCPDCEDRASDLGITLGSNNWPLMFRKMLVTEMPMKYGKVFPQTRPGYFSDTERKLGTQMYYMYVVIERQYILEGSTMDGVLHTLTNLKDSVFK